MMDLAKSTLSHMFHLDSVPGLGQKNPSVFANEVLRSFIVVRR